MDKENLDLNLSTSDDMVSQVTYCLWSATVTITRGFQKVEVNLSPDTRRVFIKIHLRWLVNTPKMKKIHDIWLRRVEKAVKDFTPSGWRVLVYYVNRR